MLDEGAKQWLALIEAKTRELADLGPTIKEELKRNERLKPGKTRLASDALLEAMAAQKSECKEFIAEETALFYKAVFGIELNRPVAVRDSTGSFSPVVFVTQLIARQLTNGLGVFTVTGDSATVDLHKGLPDCKYLMAQEAKQEWLVSMA
jgi:hypothetical protein